MILQTLFAGLPILAAQFLTTFALLGIGVAAYFAITPFDERRLVQDGNVAAGVLMGGTVLALSIPLAATLASSASQVDILIWGLVALVIQLLTFFLVSIFIRGLNAQIERGNVAMAIAVVSIQLAVALLNAGSMAG
jgi:putative membrane protein